MATFVLVPGASLCAWAWSAVTPVLRAAGHDVHPLTLTGLGDRDHLGRPETGLATHVTDVVAAIETEELEEVVLVGHSYAGIVVTGAAGTVPERIARLVYLDAVLPPAAGGSLFDAAPPEARREIEAAAAANGDGWRIPLITDAQLSLYYGNHGMTAEHLRRYRAHGSGHPLETHREPLAGELVARAWALPKTYVVCTERVFPPAVAAGAAGWEHATLEAGHWPLFTRPRETAELLDALARR